MTLFSFCKAVFMQDKLKSVVIQSFTYILLSLPLHASTHKHDPQIQQRTVIFFLHLYYKQKILFLLTPPSCPKRATKIQSDCKKNCLIHNIQRTLALNSPLSVPPFHLQDQKSYRNKLERRLFYYSFTMVLRAMRCNSLWKFTSEKHMGLLTGINTFDLPLTTFDTSLHQQH